MQLLAKGMPAALPVGTALLADAALSLVLWNLAARVAILLARLWPGLMRAIV